MSERSTEKTHEREWDEGYDLDPDEVLGVIDVTYSPGHPTRAPMPASDGEVGA